jgi:hypothetical protein
VSGYSFFNKFGFVVDPAVGVWTDVWANGGAYTFPKNAQKIRVISSSAQDGPGGTGARSVVVQGLDENFDQIEEEIITNGTSLSSLTSQKFFRVNRAWVNNCGEYSSSTTGGNAGVISIQRQNGDVQAIISFLGGMGLGQTGVARFSVPKGKQVLIYGVNVSVDSAQSAEVVLFQRQNFDDVDEPFTCKRNAISIHGLIENSLIEFFATPLLFPEKTDIWWVVRTKNATTTVSIDWSMLLAPFPLNV